MDRHGIMADYLATTIKGDSNDQRECDDKRKEGEMRVTYDDNTDAGYV